MNKFVLRQSLLLLLTATIWGVAFVAQSVGMDYVGPFTFNVMRSIIEVWYCFHALPFGKDKWKRQHGSRKKMDGKERKTLFIGGIACGVLLCIASNLHSLGSCIHLSEKQDLSQQCTLWLFRYLAFFEKKVSGKVWCGVGIAVAGLYLLCMTESGFSVQKGDFLLMLCALAFSLHILVIDYFSPKADGGNYPVSNFYLWNPVWCRDGSHGKTTADEYSCRMDADSIRRCHVLAASHTPADHRAERDESDGCIVNFGAWNQWFQ